MWCLRISLAEGDLLFLRFLGMLWWQVPRRSPPSPSLGGGRWGRLLAMSPSVPIPNRCSGAHAAGRGVMLSPSRPRLLASCHLRWLLSKPAHPQNIWSKCSVTPALLVEHRSAALYLHTMGSCYTPDLWVYKQCTNCTSVTKNIFQVIPCLGSFHSISSPSLDQNCIKLYLG